MSHTKTPLLGVALIAFLLTLIFLGTQNTSPTGAATGEEPIFGATASISPTSCANLKVLVEADCSADYELQNDIDCTGELGLTPICTGGYSGTFDGGGHTLYNLSINQSGVANVGLFCNLQNAEVINLSLMNTNINAGGWSGIVAGEAINSNFSHITMSGSLNGSGALGGLLGRGRGVIINNTYLQGLVNGSSNQVGGFAGSLSDYSLVDNSYGNFTIIGHDSTGGLVGLIDGGKISNSNISGDISCMSECGGLAGFASTYVQIDNFYSSSNVVCSKESCGGIVGGTYYGVDIDNSYTTGDVAGTNYVGGLIGYNYQSAVDSSYTTGNINGTNYVGGLIGYNYQSAVDSSYTTGNINGTDFVGGLIGQSNYYSTVDNSYSTGNVTGTNNVGGLIGYVYWYSDIDNSYATGDVTGSNKVGGLVGRLQDSALSDSFSTGNVDATTEVGGLVGGTNDANSITNCGWWTGSGPANAIGNPSTNVTYNETDPTVFYDVANTHAIYLTWDFINIWDNVSDDLCYPPLQWQNVNSSYCTPSSGNNNRPYSSSCAKDWQCSSWSLCVNKTQSRECDCNCADDSDCNGDSSTSRSCECSSSSDCNDRNDCTQDVCLNFECDHNKLTGTLCDDGNNCTVGDTCKKGNCISWQDVCGDEDDSGDDKDSGNNKQKCKSEWECRDWTDCVNGVQSRTCICECEDNNCTGDSQTSKECEEPKKDETKLDIGSINESTQGLGTETDQNGLSGLPLNSLTNWLLIIILLAVLLFLIVWKKKKKEEDL